MKPPLSYQSNMRHRMLSRKLLFPADFQIPPRNTSQKTPKADPELIYDAWLASRAMPGQTGSYLVPGAQRPLTLANAKLALFVAQHCTLDFVRRLVAYLGPVASQLTL